LGLIKSLIQAAKSDTQAYNEAMRIHNEIQMRLGGQSSITPIELDSTIQILTNDKILSQRILQAIGFKSKYDNAKPINYNKLFDAILEELEKRLD